MAHEPNGARFQPSAVPPTDTSGVPLTSTVAGQVEPGRITQPNGLEVPRKDGEQWTFDVFDCLKCRKRPKVDGKLSLLMSSCKCTLCHSCAPNPTPTSCPVCEWPNPQLIELSRDTVEQAEATELFGPLAHTALKVSEAAAQASEVVRGAEEVLRVGMEGLVFQLGRASGRIKSLEGQVSRLRIRAAGQKKAESERDQLEKRVEELEAKLDSMDDTRLVRPSKRPPSAAPDYVQPLKRPGMRPQSTIQDETSSAPAKGHSSDPTRRHHSTSHKHNSSSSDSKSQRAVRPMQITAHARKAPTHSPAELARTGSTQGFKGLGISSRKDAQAQQAKFKRVKEDHELTGLEMGQMAASRPPSRSGRPTSAWGQVGGAPGGQAHFGLEGGSQTSLRGTPQPLKAKRTKFENVPVSRLPTRFGRSFPDVPSRSPSDGPPSVPPPPPPAPYQAPPEQYPYHDWPSPVQERPTSSSRAPTPSYQMLPNGFPSSSYAPHWTQGPFPVPQSPRGMEGHLRPGSGLNLQQWRWQG